jgi:hypothetical protein
MLKWRHGRGNHKTAAWQFAGKQGLLCKPPQMINFRSRSKLLDNASLTGYPALSLPFGVKKAVERQAKQLDAVLWRGGSLVYTGDIIIDLQPGETSAECQQGYPAFASAACPSKPYLDPGAGLALVTFSK